MEYVFKTNLVEGILSIIKNWLRENVNSPIACFDQKKGIFFIYEDEWKTMTKSDFQYMFNCINSKIVKEFQNWQSDNPKIAADVNDPLYMSYLLKIMGDNNLDKYYSSLNTKLYKHIKLNLKQIVQFEFI